MFGLSGALMVPSDVVPSDGGLGATVAWSNMLQHGDGGKRSPVTAF